MYKIFKINLPLLWFFIFSRDDKQTFIKLLEVCIKIHFGCKKRLQYRAFLKILNKTLTSMGYKFKYWHAKDCRCCARFWLICFDNKPRDSRNSIFRVFRSRNWSFISRLFQKMNFRLLKQFKLQYDIYYCLIY